MMNTVCRRYGSREMTERAEEHDRPGRHRSVVVDDGDPEPRAVDVLQPQPSIDRTGSPIQSKWCQSLVNAIATVTTGMTHSSTMQRAVLRASGGGNTGS